MPHRCVQHSCVASFNRHLCAGTLEAGAAIGSAPALLGRLLLFCHKQAHPVAAHRCAHMLLLQVIHGLAHGEHAGSSRDAKQLARFAAVIRDMNHAAGTGYSDTWAGEKVTLDADDVAWLRTLINSALPHAAKLTYEARERLIAKFDSKSSVVRAFHKMRKRVLEAIVERELAKAENEKLIREARAASEAHRKRRREEMESDEHFRKYRKQAEEGDGEAAAFFESVGWPITEPAD